MRWEKGCKRFGWKSTCAPTPVRATRPVRWLLLMRYEFSVVSENSADRVGSSGHGQLPSKLSGDPVSPPRRNLRGAMCMVSPSANVDGAELARPSDCGPRLSARLLVAPKRCCFRGSLLDTPVVQRGNSLLAFGRISGESPPLPGKEHRGIRLGKKGYAVVPSLLRPAEYFLGLCRVVRGRSIPGPAGSS